MMWKWNVIACALLALLATPLANAAESADVDDEATITVIDDGVTPDDIVRVIELPDPASVAGSGKAAGGVGAANGAPGQSGASGREFGQQTAEEARSRNNAEQVRAEAKQQGRSEARGDNASDKRRGPPQ
jgi:hypothetical protein